MKPRAIMTISFLAAAPAVRADESGVSFWLPGQFDSLIAVPAEPGWSMPTVVYYATADADRDKAFLRGGRVTAGLDSTATLLFISPTYTFPTRVLGAQAAVSLTGAAGRVGVDVTATLTGPGGQAISGNESDNLNSVADLYPLGTLKWNRGHHNYMAYTMWGVPVGSYDPDRLANIGTNHWSADFGGAYTYFDPEKGQEFSATLGFTYNFENEATDYQNGIDAHLDWAASHFVSPRWHVGLVGYFYQQVTADSGAGAVLGPFKSQVIGIGPQVGWFFEAAGNKWYANFKGFHEYDPRNRPDGWNVWLTFAIPLSAARGAAPQ